MTKQQKLKNSNLPEIFRPPVVAVLGHVDHGKTSLLDVIRKTSVTEKETGGITQHIGAYQIEVPTFAKTAVGKQIRQNKITFIDTPGHEAFAKMRSRGTKVADIAILVVAATEGVKPQTVESIKYIKAADIPLIVALNKIDLPEANPERVKQQLAKEEVLVESFGGNVVMVPVSAKTGKGIPELLDTILLVSALHGLEGSINDLFEGVVIEAKLDHRRGPIATLIVKKGSLKIGQIIFAERVEAKVRAMFDDRGQNISQAVPSTPVEILGWKELPPVGASVTTERKIISASQVQKFQPKDFSLPPLVETRKLKIILKTDVIGSLEAIKENLGDKVEIIWSGSGGISESDILLAKSTDAVIIAFNTKPSKKILLFAQAEKVKIKVYQLIYKLIEEITEVVNLLTQPEETQEIFGEAVIVAEFTVNDVRIAGCRIEKGKISRGDTIRLLRRGKLIATTRVKSMRHGKQDISKSAIGEECGIIFDKKLDFIIGDRIIAYKQQEILS